MSQLTPEEIINIAAPLITSIKSDLSIKIYEKLGGQLDVKYSVRENVLANASSDGAIGGPPKHIITIGYHFIVKLYQDAEEYYRFAAQELPKPIYQSIFKTANPKPKLPEHNSKIDTINKIFTNSLSWLFFHELGHLTQEHGAIQIEFLGMTLDEIKARTPGKKLIGRPAVISHTIEYAADIEATYLCAETLVKSLFSQGISDKDLLFREYQSNLYLMMCGISIVHYRLYGIGAVTLSATPVGTHPEPIRRLNLCLPKFIETLDNGGIGSKYHGLTSEELKDLCRGAVFSYALCWLHVNTSDKSVPEDFFPKLLYNDSHRGTYWNLIIEAWDEIEPSVKRNRRFGHHFGILYFTKEFRALIAN